MNLLQNYLVHNPLFYITRDIERALGIVQEKNVFIITNSTEYSKKIAQSQENILLIPSTELLDTWELLQNPLTSDFITQHTQQKPNIVVFKNTEPIERWCKEKQWNLLNPPAKLSKQVEEKISQVEWLRNLTKYLPPHTIQLAKEVKFDETKDMPFILQFNRAHTGLGTMFISSEGELKEIQNKFPDRPVRITKFIAGGAMFTSNNVVTPHDILVGNISYQITGIQPFTQNAFATIGNDWKLPHKILKPHHIEKYKKIAKDIGDKLRLDGWKGLFGIDVIYDFETDDLFLIEINARQPASTTYESQLQMAQNNNQNEITTFVAHICALLDIDIQKYPLIEIKDGAQIIQRVIDLKKQNLEKPIKALEKLKKNLNLIVSPNTESGSDLLRIQSSESILNGHMELNTLGTLIQEAMPMTNKLLPFESLDVITKYLVLPFSGKEVSCPYFNNRRSKLRAGLRVLLGKGNPNEIVDEAKLFALREKVDLNTMSNDDIKKFLVEHNLGVDCSAFAYYILEALYRKKYNQSLASHLFYPNAKSLLRKLIIKLRAIENIDVKTFAHAKNSQSIQMTETMPGDFIIILNAGKEHNLNHILIIHKIEYENSLPTILSYCHSFQWSTDGKYNHGIKFGSIQIVDSQKSLLNQKWIESQKEGEKNETYLRASTAETLEIRRLN